MYTADNITYGTGEYKEKNIVEAGMYEVPLSLKRDPEHNYDLSESSYAVPNVYEYATLGPNEEMVTRSDMCMHFHTFMWLASLQTLFIMACDVDQYRKLSLYKITICDYKIAFQGDSSGQYYSPLDEVSLSYSKLLEKVNPK